MRVNLVGMSHESFPDLTIGPHRLVGVTVPTFNAESSMIDQVLKVWLCDSGGRIQHEWIYNLDPKVPGGPTDDKLVREAYKETRAELIAMLENEA